MIERQNGLKEGERRIASGYKLKVAERMEAVGNMLGLKVTVGSRFKPNNRLTRTGLVRVDSPHVAVTIESSDEVVFTGEKFDQLFNVLYGLEDIESI